MAASHNHPSTQLLTALVALGEEARAAKTTSEFGFVAVNRTFSLLPYATAVLLGMSQQGKPVVKAVSGLPVPESTVSFTRWLTKVAAVELGKETANRLHSVAKETLPVELAAAWDEFSPKSVLWCPLLDKRKMPIGYLWLAREPAWSEADTALAERITGLYAHALKALETESKGRISFFSNFPRPVLTSSLAALAIGTLFIPVRQSVLAPAAISARDAVIATAPMAGVIGKVLVEPNSSVRPSQPLFEFEATTLRNRLEMAENARKVTEADFLKTQQLAFVDPESKARITLLRSQLEAQTAEVAYAQQLVERSIVRAKQVGIVIFSSKEEWEGKPVNVGERVMRIADPSQVLMEIALPMDDAIDLGVGAQVQLYLNTTPFSSIRGTVSEISFDATPMPEGFMAYRVKAHLQETQKTPRIGLKGTAKLYGQKVPLYQYIFRRPLAAIRQKLGLLT
ncbi:conserved hypothetical protein [Rhodospirillaceae bacterium LM-1]|nr:conserved hypothetical protein [Rhodospirillaceae bacterium LM-1]